MDSKRPRYRWAVEVVSASAVVLSLVFVGLEVRETARQTQLNTEALQVTAYQDLLAQIAQFNEVLLDPELAALYAVMLDPNTSWSDLDVVEATQARRIMFLIVRHADMAYYQFEKGLLPEERLVSAMRPLIADIDRPVFREFWESAKENFVLSFQQYVDSQMTPG